MAASHRLALTFLALDGDVAEAATTEYGMNGGDDVAEPLAQRVVERPLLGIWPTVM